MNFSLLKGHSRAVKWALGLTIFSLLVFSVANSGTATAQHQVAKDQITMASLVQLIATPDQFHGRQVSVKGFLVVDQRHEEWHVAIYLSPEDADYFITGNGVAVSFDIEHLSARGIKPEEFDHRYVLVEGSFDKDHHGPMGMWPGEVVNVRRLVALEKGDQAAD